MGKERYKKSKERQEYDPKEVEDNVGQGELYSPSAAINHQKQQQEEDDDDERKRRVSVPKDIVEKVKEVLESAVKEASGVTREAVNQLKTRLLDILPSSVLHPTMASKAAVGDAEAEESGNGRRGDDDSDEKSVSSSSNNNSNTTNSSSPPTSSSSSSPKRRQSSKL